MKLIILSELFEGESSNDVGIIGAYDNKELADMYLEKRLDEVQKSYFKDDNFTRTETQIYNDNYCFTYSIDEVKLHKKNFENGTLEEYKENKRMIAEKEYFENVLKVDYGKAKEFNAWIVFNKYAEFMEVVNMEASEMEEYIKKNNAYAHKLSSFFGRSIEWYKLPLKEQLHSLCWDYKYFRKRA